MSRVERIAEEIKLARAMGVPVERLAYLEALDAVQLRALREAISDALVANTESALRRVAKSSGLLPPSLVAKLGQRSMGPAFCARITGLLAPDRAASVAAHMSIDFLAEISIALDPRAAREVIARLDVDRIVDAAVVLCEMDEYLTMGRMVDAVSLEGIAAVVERIRDDGALLEIAFFIEGKERLGELADLLGPERIRNMVRYAGAGEGEEGGARWIAALALMSHLDDAWTRRIGDFVVAEGKTFLARLIAAASEHRLWDTMLPVTRVMSPEARAAIARSPVFTQAVVVREVVEAAAQTGAWDGLVPLVRHFDAETREVAAKVLMELPTPKQRELVAALDEAEVFAELRAILRS